MEHRSEHGRPSVRVRAARGFTLVELLVTLTIVAIVTSMAAPWLLTTVSNNRAFAAQSELAAYLALARNEATRRNAQVVLTAASSVTGNEFGGGWSVFVDSNNDGILSTGETVLRTHEALPSTVVLGGAATVAYAPTGYLTPATAVQLKACSRNAPQGYRITIQPNGLADVDPTTGVACP